MKKKAEEPIPLPDLIKAKVQQQMEAIQVAQNNLQAYMQGYIDSLNTETQFTLDTRIWCLIPRKKEEDNAKEH